MNLKLWAMYNPYKSFIKTPKTQHSENIDVLEIYLDIRINLKKNDILKREKNGTVIAL